MRVYVTSVGKLTEDSEPVRYPYTGPNATGVDVLHAITAILSQEQNANPYYSVTKIEVEL